MKKNFLKVAALLIAAMLMVVSCSQEVAPKTEGNGLVEASLNIAYGRNLTVDGKADAEDLDLTYTMKNLWTDKATGTTEEVYGETEQPKNLPQNGKLGWVTPGYWEIVVSAKKGNTEVFKGTANIYFTSKNASAIIYLEPVGGTNNSIEFDFFMQDLGEYETDFVVKYTISLNGNPLEDHNNVEFSKTTPGEITAVDGENEHQSEYKKTISGLRSGYYTATVAVYEVKGVDEKLKGGISKGMLLAGNDAKVSGHIEPSEYIGTNLKAYYVDVDTALTEPIVDYENKKIKVTLKDTTEFNKGSDLTLGDFSRSYQFTFNGDEKTAETNLDAPRSVDGFEKSFDFKGPGPNHISCRTIYSVKVSEKDIYYWAETVEKDVLVDPSQFQTY